MEMLHHIILGSLWGCDADRKELKTNAEKELSFRFSSKSANSIGEGMLFKVHITEKHTVSATLHSHSYKLPEINFYTYGIISLPKACFTT